MFLTESMLRAIHADRVREIERATREHRLVESQREAAASSPVARRPATFAVAGAREPRAARTSPGGRRQAGTASALE
jgi:hypothetical protein